MGNEYIYKNWILDITQNKQATRQIVFDELEILYSEYEYLRYLFTSHEIYEMLEYIHSLWSFTDADALAIYNWWETYKLMNNKVLYIIDLQWSETWTTTLDQSTNDRDWTPNGWVTRDYIYH